MDGVPGTDSFQRGTGEVDQKTLRVALGGGSLASPGSPMGSQDDAPATTPTSTTEATMISLLKKIANASSSVELAGDLYVTQDEVESALGRIAENLKVIDPDAASASLNSLLRGILAINSGVNAAKIGNRTDSTTDVGITYVGETLTTPQDTSTSTWRITKIDNTGAETIITTGGGTTNFDQEWDERALAGSVVYS